MIIRHDFSLLKYNNLKLDCKAANFTKITIISELTEFKNMISNQTDRINIIGSGSRILLTGDLPGLTVQNSLRGADIVRENEDHVIVGVNSGERWDKLVDWTLKNQIFGLENLSGIQGTVAGAVINNAGAFGVQVSDVIEGVVGVGMDSSKESKMTPEECKFNYHSSIFKTELKGKFFIYRVLLRLSRKPDLKTNYREIKQGLMYAGEQEITPILIREILLKYLSRREPGYKFPNAGSFFKNPVVDLESGDKLKEQFPDIVLNKIDEAGIKIPAGWLIKKAGWIGQKIGNAAVYKPNPAILINLGNAKPMDFLVLMNAIKNDVFEKMGVTLEEEIEKF